MKNVKLAALTLACAIVFLGAIAFASAQETPGQPVVPRSDPTKSQMTDRAQFADYGKVQLSPAQRDSLTEEQKAIVREVDEAVRGVHDRMAGPGRSPLAKGTLKSAISNDFKAIGPDEGHPKLAECLRLLREVEELRKTHAAAEKTAVSFLTALLLGCLLPSVLVTALLTALLLKTERQEIADFKLVLKCYVGVLLGFAVLLVATAAALGFNKPSYVHIYVPAMMTACLSGFFAVQVLPLMGVTHALYRKEPSLAGLFAGTQQEREAR